MAEDATGLNTWKPWLAALGCLYGCSHPQFKRRPRLVKHCTGRRLNRMPTRGFDTALFLTGRRSGKSRISAVVAAYEAAISGKHKKLSSGEVGVVPIISPTRQQSRIVKTYVRAVFDQSPLLQGQILDEQKAGFTLQNGVRIEIITGDWRTVRGYTLLAAIIDEICFFGFDSEGKIKSDSELVRALEPALATTGGKLIGISSPYAKRGWSYKQFTEAFGDDKAETLVWNCSSRTMNPTLPKSVIERAMKKDKASALAEYGGQFRDDIGAFISRELVEACVRPERTLLPPLSKSNKYIAFADLSGGVADDAALAIAHQSEGKVLIDSLTNWKPPFDPSRVIEQMAAIAKRYGCRRVNGDRYAAGFVTRGFDRNGIKYRHSQLNRSELYLELLPILTSRGIELLDRPDAVDQLCSLERKTRSGGRDSVDHPPTGHDDLANVLAGAAVLAHHSRKQVGTF